MESGPERRPRLAVAFDAAAIAPLQLHDAVGELCDLIWLIDTTLSHVGPVDRLLGRLGTVIDITGLPTDEVADALASQQADGIVAFSDRRVALVADLADRLGLAGMSPAVAERVLDKFHQRRAFEAAGLPGPRAWRVGANDDLGRHEVVRAARFPVVVKPEMGDASRHVQAADDEQRLVELLGLAQAAGRDSVVEEFIVGDPDFRSDLGDYVSVESVAAGGVITHLAVTGRFPVAEPFRETGFFMPALLEHRLQRRVLDVASAAIAALGVEDGCLHTEIKLTPAGPQIIEVNGRLGGGMADLLGLVSEVDLFELVARVALRLPVEHHGVVDLDRVAYLFYVQPPMGATRVSSVVGLEELRGRPEVANLRLNREPGSALDWRDGNHGYVFSVLGTVDSIGELVELERVIGRTVTATFE